MGYHCTSGGHSASTFNSANYRTDGHFLHYQIRADLDLVITPTKSKKSRSHSSRPAKKTGSQKTPKKRSTSAKSTKKEVDIFSPAAMENLYYISHNAVDCLEFRGFGQPNSKKKKKTKRVKKKKKK